MNLCILSALVNSVLVFIILLSVLCILKRLGKNSLCHCKGAAHYKEKALPCICCYSYQAAFLGSKENHVCSGTNAEECCVLFQKQKLLPTGLEIAN